MVKEKNKVEKVSEPEETKKPKDLGSKKRKIPNGKMILWGVLGAIILLIIGFGILVYAGKNESQFTKTVSRVLPYPSQIIDGKFISIYSYLNQVDILKKYYSEFKKVDFNSEDGKTKLSEIRADVLDRLAEDAIVAKEAKKVNIKVENKFVNEEYDKLIASNGGQKNFSEILQKYYGLTIDEYKNAFFKPRLLREKLTEKINGEEEETGVAKKKAEEIIEKAKAGEDFAKLATEYSGDPGSASNGGDLGFFGKGKMVTEFETAAFEAKVGEIVGPVKTVYGYHIIKVTDKKGDEVKASHILIKTRDFNEWLFDLKKNLKEKKFLGFIPAYWTLIKN